MSHLGQVHHIPALSLTALSLPGRLCTPDAHSHCVSQPISLSTSSPLSFVSHWPLAPSGGELPPPPSSALPNWTPWESDLQSPSLCWGWGGSCRSPTWLNQVPSPFPPSSYKRVPSLASPAKPGQCSKHPSMLPPSCLGSSGMTYIENEEGIGAAVELCQLVPDLIHEVAVTWMACDTGGVDRGDGKGAPCPVFPVQNQQQGHDS